MADDNNILIEIKSAFDKSGTDQAERAQDRLAGRTKDLNRTLDDNEKATHKARQALAGMNAASAASQGSFGGLSRVLENFSGRLAEMAAKATLVAGAFSAGYGLGTAIDKWLGISKAVADAYAPMEKVASIQDRIRAQLGDLNSASLAGVKAQFDELSSTLSATMSQMDQVNRVKNQLMGGETEAQLAEIEASMAPGPARDKAVLTKRREREQASIDERRNQARDKLAVTERTVGEGRKALSTTQDEEEAARTWYMIVARNKDATLEQKAIARQKLDAAERARTAATARAEELDIERGKALMDKSNTMRGLTFEERTSRARFSGGMQTISLREQEEAKQLAARQLGIREGVANDMRGIGAQATRSALSSQLEDLGERADTMRSRGMPAARVADLRAKAAGTYKQADSAVAAVAQVLDSITARMKSLEDKLKNLPR